MDFVYKEKYTLEDLLRIMELLRSEEGCPWDREQTHESIRKNLIEEAYETAEAIDKAEPELLKEELGDVLLQVVFHAQMEAEKGSFGFDDVADRICQKLILRHPHIFSSVHVDSADQVLENWDRIKKKEKGQSSAAQTLEAVPAVLPALMRAQKVQQRAARTGFDYDSRGQALEELKSELDELQEAISSGSKADVEEELGDLIFAAVNVARFTGIDGEEALTRSTEKFISRFTEVERLAAEQEIDMANTSLNVLNELWRKAKQNCR